METQQPVCDLSLFLEELCLSYLDASFTSGTTTTGGGESSFKAVPFGIFLETLLFFFSLLGLAIVCDDFLVTKP